ncbi:hypothetical protein Pla110_31340 [Polystyrenella longa]|uniref:BioF2-like acetyltransferase domain-containing protein n=1 Tax=Polystyrenella longa TaxID=2528007 RepID=A0A518CQ98_9PLAN|nr:GNAT family N-acetyltransferase [Polystyrenella longa]QDU81393.1 hypothetical protein Pla110_31340 [Polystyrenella longa]
MLIVTEYHNLEELKTVSDVWNRLWSQTPDSSFLHSYEAFEATCALTGLRDDLKVLMVSLMGKPIGFVPFVIRPMETSLGTLRVLTFPMEEWFSFYNTIGPHKTIILQAAIKHLKKSDRNWDYLDWTGLLKQGREKERLETAGILHGMKMEQHSSRECSVINLEKGWYSFWTNADAEMRQTAHSMERRLQGMGRLRLMRCRSIAENQVDEPGENLIYQHLQKILSENLANPIGKTKERRGTRNSEFISRIHNAAVGQAVADWSVLYVDDEPIAAAYGLAHQGRLEMLSLSSRVGWPMESRLVLMKMLLEDSCRRGDLNIMIPTTWGSVATCLRNETFTTCRFVCTPMTSWKVHALKTTRIVQEWLGKPKEPVGFYDEKWNDRRDERPLKLNVLA